MITCRSCNTPNQPDAQFCIGCGTPLVTEPVTPAGAVHCPSCNAVNPPEAQFCVTCGAPLSTAPVYETAPTPEPVAAPRPAPAPPAPSAAPAPAPSPAHAAAASATLKDRTTALLLEILPAFVGVFGIGWIYSGNTTAGVLLMVGMLVWDVLGVLGSIATLGVGCFCFVPINLVVMGISAYFLNEHTRQHPELFGAKTL
jgi:ribosomal protein L40E